MADENMFVTKIKPYKALLRIMVGDAVKLPGHLSGQPVPAGIIIVCGLQSYPGNYSNG